MAVFNHFFIFLKVVKKSNIDWIFFLWSELGNFTRCYLYYRNSYEKQSFDNRLYEWL